jgi:hypothetical protein
MATTTNYGWDTPDDTDLVKDGALAMRDLGQDVETSLFSITNGKNVGMSLISAQSVTTAGTITFQNVFSSTFENYYITITGVTSTSGQIAYRNANSGTPTTGNTYTQYEVYAFPGAANPQNYSAAVDRVHAGESGTLASVTTILVTEPFAASPTRIRTEGFGIASTSVFLWTNGIAQHSASTSYDGFVITTSAGTFTGDIRVYGLRTS